MTISMDANFGLVRKKHSGQSATGPNMTDSFFMSSDEVENFVSTYNNTARDKVQLLDHQGVSLYFHQIVSSIIVMQYIFICRNVAASMLEM